jgi:5-methylcytosine-specific restriction protein A
LVGASGSSYCPQHQPRRASATERGYDARWQRYSRAFLKKHPFCADPYGRHRGVLVEADVTGHRKAHRGDQTLLWDRANHYALCRACNSYQCVKEEGGFGNAMLKA